MLCLRKMKFSADELEQIKLEYGDYLWAAVDLRRSLITAGDEYLSDLRDYLLTNHSRPEDILCAGLNLNTGEIFFPALINRRNPRVGRKGIPDDDKERVRSLMRYFFESIPGYQEERKRPRYSKKPSALSFD